MEFDGFKDLEQQRQAREDFFEKAFDPTYIEKGKRAQIGEIRTHGGVKVQKQGDGSWKPVREEGEKSVKNKPVGSTHEYNGKKYKKQANGKWVEVSEHGMTKREHENLRDEHAERAGKANKQKETLFHDSERKKHRESASKLSDKEHSDEEVGLGSKKEEPKKSEPRDEDKIAELLKEKGLGDVMNTTWPEEFESSKKYNSSMTNEEYAKALFEYIKNN